MAGDNRCTKSEHLQRVGKVEECLMLGYTRSKILEEIGQKYGVGESQVENYMTAAYKRIREINDRNLEDTRAWLFRKYIEVFNRAVEAGNIQEQRGCLNSIAKISGAEQAPEERPAAIPDLADQDLRRDLKKDLNQEAIH